MKRYLSYLVLLLTMFMAAQTVSADDVWNFDASTGHLTVYKDVNYDYDLFYYWHEYRGQIKSIEFGSKVTKIGKYAFRDCTSLTSVIIPKGVTSIGQYAFEGCSALADVTIPQSVTSIGKGAIRLCPSLTSIIIPNSVTNIDEFTFYGCSSLMSVTIPEGVTSIGGRAFQNCSSLASVTIPQSVTSIGERAFYGCENLKTVHNLSSLGMSKGSDIHGYVAYYADVVENEGYSYSYNTKKLYVTKNYDCDMAEYPWNSFRNLIEMVVVSSNVTKIGNDAFNDCTALRWVTIPEGVTNIGIRAFQNCSSLADVTIPQSVTSIGERAFYGCENLKTVYNYSSLDIIKGSETHGFVAYYADKVDIMGIRLELTRIELRQGEGAVLEVILNTEGTVTWSSSDNRVATVRNYEDESTLIGANAGLVRAEGVGTAIITATAGKNSATCEVTVMESNIWSFDSSTGRLYVFNDYDLGNVKYPWYSYRRSIRFVRIGANVTCIGAWAFNDCTALIEAEIPEGVTSIGECAFEGCSSLWSITIPESVTSIGNGTFFNCSSLMNITIPESVTSIGNYAFRNCTGLTSITIPESVTSIGEYAFAGCSSLTSITIPESVTSIGENAFSGCENLKTVYNYSSLDIVKGADTHGRVAYYADKVLTKGVYFDYTSLYFQKDDKYALSVTVFPEMTVTWSSSDANVATVDQRGNVTAVGAGTATITATAGDYSATCKVTVRIPFIPVNGITLNQKIASLFVDESMTLSAEVTLEDATDKTVTWSSSDVNVATVDQRGNVTAVGAGTATITATVGDYSATCEVTVTKQVSLVTLTDGVYYMKNVGAGLFLTGGNAWGTYGTFSENGFDVTVTILPSGKFVIDTKVDNLGNHYLGADGFIDAPQAEWTIEPQTDGTYAITNDGVNYIGYDGSTTVLNLHLTNPSEDNARWQFMTYEEVMAEICTATKDNPKIVTMLLPGASFNKNDTRNGLWSDAPTVGGYLTAVATNMCGEKWNTPSFDVAQTLTNVPNGYYKVSMQGFYRMGGDGSKNDATIAVENHAAGTETLNAIFYANNEEKPLMSIIEGAQAEEFAYGQAFNTSYGYVPQNIGAAAATFTDGKYEHSLWVVVTDGTLRVGVKKDAESVNDWTIFDNFRIVYYGNHASGISIDRASMKLLKGESMTLSAEVTPEDATDAVTWSSSDASVATVDQNGNVTAVGAGTATITATAGDCSATCEVTVTIPVIPVSGITLSQNAASLFVDEDMTLSAEVTPEDATDKTVTWSSSNASVATVDQNGNVTAVGAGTATITATAGDYSATCEVTVTKQVSLVTLTDGVYYMKNVGAGLFLTGGNSWGTQGTFSENGFDVTVTTLPTGKYVIDTKVDNWGNHYLGADGFIDAPQAEWTIEPQTDGTYTITNDGVNYIGYDGSTTVLNLHLTNSSEDNARWQFMTYEEVMAEICTATKDNPKTVTMLLPGAAFNQGDTRNGLWSDEPAVGGYQTEFASNKCGEKWNTPSFDVAQTLTNVPNGYYKVSMQGFYRMGGDENVYDASLAEAHHKDGTETLNAIFYANNEEKRLMSIIEGAQAEEFAYGGAFYTAYGNVPQDMDAAAAAFTDGKYEHSLWVEVTDGTLRVGVKKDAESVNDWTIFDNFRVVYYGTQQPDAIEEATAVVTFQTNDVYDLSGRLVRRQAESLVGLKPGVYIVNGKKYMVK